MIDIKLFTETKEELNGFYLGKMKQFKFPDEIQKEFFRLVDERFHSTRKLEDECIHYERVIRFTFKEFILFHNRMISKMEKKNIKNRGNVIWNSMKGQYVNTKK